MGLDMYLHACRYIAGYEFMGAEAQALYSRVVDAADARAVADKETPTAEVKVVIGYWRKANAIHRWFVENVQGGEDECRPWYVSREQLEQLRFACKVVLKATKTEQGKVHVGTTFKPGGKVVENFEPGKVVTNPSVAEEHLPTASGFFFGSVEYDEFYLDDLERTVAIVDRALAAPEGWSFEYQSSW